MSSPIEKEIEEFYTRIRARALLIAIEWAGSASALGELAGFSRYTGTKWFERGAISTHGALRLVRLKGFPLRISELCPGIQVDRYRSRECPHCWRTINAPTAHAGCLPLLKSGHKRTRRNRLAKQAAKRKQQTAPSDPRTAKR